MKEPVWLSKTVVLALHDQLLAEHGGSAGVRDGGLLDSALGKPRNLFAYAKPTSFDMAASYAAGIVRNHPFIDGNKRTGFMAAYTFLGRNGIEFIATEVDVVLKTLGLAVNDITEEEYAAWLKQNSRRPTRAKN